MIGPTELAPEALSRFAIESRAPEEKRTELGQDAFLKLMLTQLKHQDPLSPMENGEFLGQMAQFSTVSGIEKMQDSLENLAGAYGSSQTLQASALVGREIVVEGDSLVVGDSDDAGDSVRGGRFELDTASGDVTLDVFDASGSLVRRLPLGQHAAGTHEFLWDGRDEDGDPVEPGTYTASVTAASGEDRVALNVLVARTVDSVEFAPGGLVQLNATGGERFTLDDVRHIGESRTL